MIPIDCRMSVAGGYGGFLALLGMTFPIPGAGISIAALARWRGSSCSSAACPMVNIRSEREAGMAMREVIRPETLYREVIPIAVFTLIVAIIFLIALFANRDNLADASAAVQ